MTDLQQIVRIVFHTSALDTIGKCFFFVGLHSASSWTSSGQTLHAAKSDQTSCVGLALLSLIDSSVLGVVCFAAEACGNVVCVHTHISLLEVTRSCLLDLDCLRIAILSLGHRAQFLEAKVLTALIVFPCQMMLQVVL